MAKERLSKLQKWILGKCYERRNNTSYMLFRREITSYLGGNNSAEVVVSRSIRNLIKKGLIAGLRGRKLIDSAGGFDYAMQLVIMFKKEGKTKEDYDNHIKELMKRGGKNEKYPSPSLPEETIQAVEVTQKGIEVYALMLSKAKISKLNNKE